MVSAMESAMTGKAWLPEQEASDHTVSKSGSREQQAAEPQSSPSVMHFL